METLPYSALDRSRSGLVCYQLQLEALLLMLLSAGAAAPVKASIA